MNIAILHGYGLMGSGSNLYVNRLSSFLCRAGQDVHVICQERSEELPPHFTRVIDYDPLGQIRADKLLRASDGAHAVLHRPFLGPVLPVYNWDHYPGFDCVKTFLELTDQELASYVENHVITVQKIVEYYQINLVHANHVVAMPEVARRVSMNTGCRFLITPHGSAIEYVVKKDANYAGMAKAGLEACDGLIVGGSEMLDRIEDLWAPSLSVREKSTIAPTGVDLALFTPREDVSACRPTAVSSNPSGCSAKLMDEYFDASCSLGDHDLLQLSETYRARYSHRSADADLDAKLDAISWGSEPLIVFAGKLVAGKGIHALVTASAFLGRARLLIVGEGSFREPLELLFRAIIHRDLAFFRRLVALGWEFDHKPREALHHLEAFTAPRRFEELCSAAERTAFGKRVAFLGYLEHRELAPVLASADVTVLPSIVPEAYPLSLAESLAVGIPPVATGIGGTKRFFEETLSDLPEDYRDLELNASPERLVSELCRVLEANIQLAQGPVHQAREVAEARFGWPAIARRVRETYCTTAAVGAEEQIG